ncbi:hypothetical protein [Bacillus paranthracis]|uniref:Uncharacterized protein n=1 Tax=Bacillus paranthracis TaxID=2026186 RepID=A0AAJ1K6N0_9BACI|nr:hypothetical protein [Bacillus paranthracis]MDG0949873.1 hypothetical protein [Bacillus paranthracis]MDG0955704.1 hypothetical protein [Bacillus paranthracis]
MTRERLWEQSSVITILKKTKITAILMVYKDVFIVPIQLRAMIRGGYAYNVRYYASSVQYTDWFQKTYCFRYGGYFIYG